MESRRKLTVLLTLLFIVGLGVLIYAVSVSDDSPPPPTITETAPEPSITIVPVPEPEPEIATEPESEPDVTPLVPPTFDVVRLESDGSLVIAGTGSPNSEVELLTSTDTLLAAESSDSSGDFVLVLDDLLSSGDYILHLRSTSPDGRQITSNQTAVLHVPSSDSGDSDDVLVIVNEDGQASRIITKPADLESQSESGSDIESSSLNLQIEAVEVEGGRIYVAGAVDNEVLVRVYIDNDVLGTVRGNPQGRFLLDEEYELSSGTYIVRADVVDSQDGSVLARVEVDLLHEVEDSSNDSALRTGSHIISIKRGDTLWQISQKIYGSGFRYTTIYNANRNQIRDPDLIYVGQVFKLPDSPQSDE